MNKRELLNAFEEGRLDCQLIKMTGCTDVSLEKKRWVEFLKRSETENDNLHLLSVSGRTEIGGNHTDHQRGCVLAASLSLDTIAAAGRLQSMKAAVFSEGFEIKTVDLTDLSVHLDEKESSEALIRGVAAGFVKRGYQIGGFEAVMHSQVLKGSGMSSSASFEVMIGLIFSVLYNDGKVAHEELAKIAQEAENVYFGKPCGLMDQMACAMGGAVAIDFKDLHHPVLNQIDFKLNEQGYALCLVDTGGSHADLSAEYGKMPYEMKEVASLLGVQVLSETTKEDFYQKLPEIKGKLSDRSLLRAMHYFDETERAQKEALALKENRFKDFLELVNESGRSSFMYLQNVVLYSDSQHQPLALSLALSEQILKGKGAWRVHGGGLAGTIQAFVPHELLKEYQTKMEACFGKGSCHVLSIRPYGAFQLV